MIFYLLLSVMLAKRSGIYELSGLAAPLGFSNFDKYISLVREPVVLINSWLFGYPKDKIES